MKLIITYLCELCQQPIAHERVRSRCQDDLFIPYAKRKQFCEQCRREIEQYNGGGPEPIFWDLQDKEADKEIKVGDEIEYECFGATKGVVISKYEEENRVGYKVLCANGCGQLIYANTAMPRKTGRHFPQIAEVLEQMQGE